MRPYVELGCGSCGVAAQRGLGAILPLESGMRDGVVLLGGVELADTIVSPGAVSAAMRDIDQHAAHLGNDIRQNLPRIMETAVGQRFYNDWVTWFADWTGWYAQNRSGYGWSTQVAYITTELVARIRQYAGQYNDLERRYHDVTGLDPSYNPDAPSGQILPTEAWIAIGIGAGVLSLGFLAWGASSVAKVARPLSGRRRR